MIEVLKTSESSRHWVTDIRFTPDGRYLLAGHGEYINLWDYQGRELLHTFIYPGFIRSLCVSPDGSLLAGLSDDLILRVWNLSTWECLHTIPVSTHRRISSGIEFSPDGKSLALGGEFNTAQLWSLEAGHLHTFMGHDQLVVAVSFSPDGRYLATGSWDGTTRLYRMDELVEEYTLIGPTDWVERLAWSPDGKYLAIGSRDAAIYVWSIDTLKEGGIPRQVETLRGMNVWVSGLAFSPDSRFLAASSASPSARVWSTETWSIEKDLRINSQDHRCWMTTLRFSPIGELITGDESGLITIY
jgi:WD40 repeat protein